MAQANHEIDKSQWLQKESRIQKFPVCWNSVTKAIFALIGRIRTVYLKTLWNNAPQMHCSVVDNEGKQSALAVDYIYVVKHG